jgi:hypothetical protein
VRLPHPEHSFAVLIGVSTYQSDDLVDLPAVQNNLADLQNILTDPGLGALPAARCVPVPEAADVRAVYRTLRRYAANAEDTLLIYFSGHGRTGPRNELYLCLAETDPDELPVSALSFDLVREIFRDSPAANRILILDCCFSGRAIPDMSGADEAVLGQVAIEGTYTLTATPANAVALAPVGAAYTAFTGELLTLLRSGVTDGPPLLTFSEIYRQLLSAMTARGLPLPQQRGTGTVPDLLALTRNAAHTRSTTGPQPPATSNPSDVRISYDPPLRRSGNIVVGSLLVGLAVITALWAWPGPSWLPNWVLGVGCFFCAFPAIAIGSVLARRAEIVISQTGVTVSNRRGENVASVPWRHIVTVGVLRDTLVVRLRDDAPQTSGFALSNDLWKLGYVGLCRLQSVGKFPDSMLTALERFAPGKLVRTEREFLRRDPKLRPNML